MRLNDLLRALEDSGEVNYKLAEHSLKKDDAGNFSVKSLVPVCFVLDPIKSNKRKKQKADWHFFPKLSLLIDGLVEIVQHFSQTLLKLFNWNLNWIIVVLLVQASASALTFGAKMDFAKLRSCSNIHLIWRLRQGFEWRFHIHLLYSCK